MRGIATFFGEDGEFAIRSRALRQSPEKESAMLWTIFVILLILWLVGVVSSYTLGGFIHILLLLALITLVINLVSGRRTVV